MNIGIDLGTTYSVIAIKGQVELHDGYPPAEHLPECNVTIIPTPNGDHTFPSAFWVDPNDPNHIVVGTDAKQKADGGHSPIMFSKRSIGTDEPLKMNDRTYTAKEVATHILRHLKACAEQALSRPVRQAIITHPAHFTPNQVEETREAAIAAGFDMSLPEQMMMEPTAAAVAYFMDDKRDPLRVLAYDLGGGTFDVTILERREGIIKMKAFEGNHLLGGYNFDRALVQEMLARLKAAGRNIPYDENSPEDRGRRARMLQIAENVKMQLSEQKNDRTFVPFRAQNLLVDEEGRNVQLLERINREQYMALIKDYLDQTIDCCRRALAKAEMSAGDLDAILLVGGSTYGQWVMKAITDEFKLDVTPYHPDLCVAAGAALMAAELPTPSFSADFMILPDVTSTSALPNINVSGVLLSRDGKELSAETRAALAVSLRTPLAGRLGPVALSENGRFIFHDVALLEDEPSRFALQVSDANGAEQLAHEFTVEYTPDGGEVTTISTSLPQPLYLRVVGGLKLIAEEGVPLPAKCEVTTKRRYTEPTLKIPIYLKEDEIGSVLIENIPENAGEGCPVELKFEISETGHMRGHAKVLNRNQAVVAESDVLIKFPPIPLPTLPQLLDKFDALEDKRQQELALSSVPARRTELGGKGEKLANQVKRLLAEQEPDKQEINSALREMDRLVNPPADDMEPPRDHFMQLLEDCRSLIDSKGSDPEVQPLRQMWDRINEAGRDALITKNHRKWATAYESLSLLHDRVSKLGKTNGDGTPPPSQKLPPTEILKLGAHQQVSSLRAALATERMNVEGLPDYQTLIRRRVEAIEKELDQIDANIDKVSNDLPSEQGLAQLQITLQALRPLATKIRDLAATVE